MANKYYKSKQNRERGQLCNLRQQNPDEALRHSLGPQGDIHGKEPDDKPVEVVPAHERSAALLRKSSLEKRKTAQESNSYCAAYHH
ncbi:unnamed protein product [Gongylonema pulchrum]|uniref:Small hydrophilic protein n=1 Tax=Gongylonema pulchrum TaxID=637853 RepID=A0A183D627_9BILA|nr:unnamed protein product [Gongylonema pulchrum]